MKFDHHLHTRKHSPDSVIDPLEMIAQARRIGLDGLVITEHDYQWQPDELAKLAEQAAPLKVFSGAEVSTMEGHFLVYGLPSLEGVFPGIRLSVLLKVVERHQAAIVAAHPFRWDQPFDDIVDTHGPVFHALELVSNNVTSDTRGKAETLLQRYPMGATGSSDAHDIGTLGCYFTEFDQPIHSIEDFVSAIRAGRSSPRHRDGARLTSGPINASMKY
jgi:predicted metal-dependent phosphoesterase TrpH